MATDVQRVDLEAEAACLSAALLDTDAALELVELLGPQDFHADANRQVFVAVRSVLAAGGHADVVAVAAKLRVEGRLEQIGGAPYLAQLADATPAVAHVADHARIVRNLARVRRAGDVFHTLATEARTLPIDDADAWLESCEVRSLGATHDRGVREETAADYRVLVRRVYDQVSAASRAERPALGRRTGFQRLDNHLGGLQPGELIVVAGRPGMGKTALAMQIAEYTSVDVAGAGVVIVFSLEMTKEQLMLRSLARRSGYELRALREGKARDGWDPVTDAVKALAPLPVIVDDDSELTPLRMRGRLRRHAATMRTAFPKLPLAAIVVDYIQLMGADMHRGEANRVQEIGQITRALKITAKENRCPVIALSQLRRPPPGKAAPRPTLSDLRDSGTIEQDADVVIAIHRADYYREPAKRGHVDLNRDGKAELLVLKGRNSGEGVHVVSFDGARTAFVDDERGTYANPYTDTNGDWFNDV